MAGNGLHQSLTLDGVTRSMADWGRLISVEPKTIGWRLHMGWTVEEALTIPAGGRRDRPRAAARPPPPLPPGVRRGAGYNPTTCPGCGLWCENPTKALTCWYNDTCGAAYEQLTIKELGTRVGLTPKQVSIIAGRQGWGKKPYVRSEGGG